MRQKSSYRIKLVLVGVVAAVVLGGSLAKADFTFGEPTNLGPPVNSAYVEYSPFISADGLSLYFGSNRPGGEGGWDIWVTTRETKDDEWGTPMNLGPPVNSWEHELCPNISADGLSIFFMSMRPGGSGYQDLWVATRDTVDAPWSEAVNLGPTINSSAGEVGPSISADGLTLYFSDFTSPHRPGGYGKADIWFTTRPTKDDPWGEPVNLGPTVNSSASDRRPLISADGLMLYFDSTRPGGYGQGDLYVTTRATLSDPWGTPVNLGPTVNSSAWEEFPSISPDGSTLYFDSEDRPGGPGGSDLWQAPILPIVDLNSDGVVDAIDMCIMVDHWGEDYPLCDIGPMPWGDGIVDVQDLIVLAEYLFTYPGTVAYWKLDETEGMFAADSVGDNDAFVTGGTAWQPGSGQVDGALQLDGISGCAITGPVLNPSDGTFSVVAWVKGGDPGQVLVSQQSMANWLAVDADGNLMTELKCTGRSAGYLFSETVITDGQWHRIGLVWDGSLRKLYVDGVVVANDIQPGLEGSQMGLYIGTGKAMEPRTYFSGLIDDVRIYNRAVSP